MDCVDSAVLRLPAGGFGYGFKDLSLWPGLRRLDLVDPSRTDANVRDYSGSPFAWAALLIEAAQAQRALPRFTTCGCSCRTPGRSNI